MKVQKLLKARRKNPTKSVAKEFIFRGLIHCSTCGCLYSPECKRGYLNYYSCTDAKHTHKRQYIKEETLLAPIYEVLDKLQLSEERINELVQALRQATESKGKFQEFERGRLGKILTEEQAVIDGAAVKFAKDEIQKDVYDRIIAASREKQRNAQTQLNQHTNADENYFITAERVLNLARRARQIFESSEIPEKRRLIGFLLQNLTADGKNLQFTLRSPFNEMIELNDHPNGLGD